MENLIGDKIKYIGVDDKDIDLFESQYIVPNGISYNSYIILDEKICVMDTVDGRKTDEWLKKLEAELCGRAPDYLVISHMEPDHASNIQLLAEKYPQMKLVGNAKTFSMLPQFFSMNIDDRKLVVKERDTLSLGEHTLTFYMAPMVHWPEVMVTYESSEKILFTADGFGKFGALDTDEPWVDEARRYYVNICGKYGAQVQALLKKAAALDISKICPLHGPVLSDNLSYYIGLYDTWSKYLPESDGIFIAYASIHGKTKAAAEKLCELLRASSDKEVVISDLSRTDMAQNVADAFKYSTLVAASSTYDGGLFPAMNDFLYHLKIKTYRNRRVALIENGSWTPLAAKSMREYFDSMKNIEILPDAVTIRSSMSDENKEQLKNLAQSLIR